MFLSTIISVPLQWQSFGLGINMRTFGRKELLSEHTSTVTRAISNSVTLMSPRFARLATLTEPKGPSHGLSSSTLQKVYPLAYHRLSTARPLMSIPSDD
eukprot:4841376-Heterocapsa_arctica.AAC.1